MTAGKVAIILLFVFTLTQCEWSYKKIDSSSGMYFEETGRLLFYTEEWKVVSNVNLTKYHIELKSIRKTVDGIMTNCDNLNQIESKQKTTVTGNEGCGSALFHLKNLMADIDESDINYFGFLRRTRRRRSLLPKTVLDDWRNDNVAFYREFANMTASGSESRTTPMFGTTYIMSILNTGARSSENDRAAINDHVAGQLGHIRGMLDAAEIGSLAAVRQTELKRTLQELIVYQVSTLTTFAAKQKRYLSVLSLLGTNNVQIRTIVSASNLLAELKTVEYILEEMSMYFLLFDLTTENVHQLFDVTTADISLYRDQIFLTFKCPLIRSPSDYRYTLFKATSSFYPLTGNLYTFVIPNHEFIAINAGKTKYIALTIDDLNSCRPTHNDTQMVCKQRSPAMYTAASSECEVMVLLQKLLPPDCKSRFMRNTGELYMKVLQPNTWLVTMPREVNVRYICNAGQMVKVQRSVKINGLLTIDNDCQFATGNVYLVGDNTVATGGSVIGYQIGNFSTKVQREFNTSSFMLTDSRFQSNNVSQVIGYGEMDRLYPISYSANDLRVMRQITDESGRVRVEMRADYDIYSTLAIVAIVLLLFIFFMALHLRSSFLQFKKQVGTSDSGSSKRFVPSETTAFSINDL